MGYGIAESCLRAGHLTHGFDVVQAQVKRFQDDGGSLGDLADIAGTLDALIVVVLNAAQTEEVLFGQNGVVPSLTKGAVVLASATVPRNLLVIWKHDAIPSEFTTWTPLFQVVRPRPQRGSFQLWPREHLMLSRPPVRC